jgi:hypothetical protein
LVDDEAPPRTALALALPLQELRGGHKLARARVERASALARLARPDGDWQPGGGLCDQVALGGRERTRQARAVETQLGLSRSACARSCNSS